MNSLSLAIFSSLELEGQILSLLVRESPKTTEYQILDIALRGVRATNYSLLSLEEMKTKSKAEISYEPLA